MKSAIIIGTAVDALLLPGLEEQVIRTAYGEAVVLHGTGDDRNLFILPRHGPQHSLPPHRINYRANLQALVDLGVQHVLASYAVGSINRDIPPLGLVALDDFIDFTSGRETTFFDGLTEAVTHVDMSEPFCGTLRDALLEKASQLGMTIRRGGTYVCTNGPRLESPAEIRMYEKLGADVVGMTLVPEAVLARERGLCFAAVAFSVNWAAGIQPAVQFVEDGLTELGTNLFHLFIQTLRDVEAQGGS